MHPFGISKTAEMSWIQLLLSTSAIYFLSVLLPHAAVLSTGVLFFENQNMVTCNYQNLQWLTEFFTEITINICVIFCNKLNYSHIFSRSHGSFTFPLKVSARLIKYTTQEVQSAKEFTQPVRNWLCIFKESHSNVLEPERTRQKTSQKTEWGAEHLL